MSISTLPSANQILSIFRSKGVDSRIGPLKHADTSQSSLLQSLAREISQGRAQCNEVLFTTGLGLSDSREVPLRLPAILVPALCAMERQKELGFDPSRYLVYQATDFIADANGIDHSQALEVSKRMEHYLRRYVKEVHPSIKDRVEFRFERDKDPQATEAIEQLIGEISDEASIAIFDRLTANESVHSNRNGQAMRYGAANVLYNGADPERYPFAESTHHHSDWRASRETILCSYDSRRKEEGCRHSTDGYTDRIQADISSCFRWQSGATGF
jgi:hypothetical protein